MSSHCYKSCNVFTNKNVDVMISPGCNTFHVLLDKQIKAHFKYFQIKTHVQTAHEYDLNMDFCSFDNGFKQLCAIVLCKS